MHLFIINPITMGQCYQCQSHHHTLFLNHHILLKIILPTHPLNPLLLDPTERDVQIPLLPARL